MFVVDPRLGAGHPAWYWSGTCLDTAGAGPVRHQGPDTCRFSRGGSPFCNLLYPPVPRKGGQGDTRLTAAACRPSPLTAAFSALLCRVTASPSRSCAARWLAWLIPRSSWTMTGRQHQTSGGRCLWTRQWHQSWQKLQLGRHCRMPSWRVLPQDLPAAVVLPWGSGCLLSGRVDELATLLARSGKGWVVAWGCLSSSAAHKRDRWLLVAMPDICMPEETDDPVPLLMLCPQAASWRHSTAQTALLSVSRSARLPLLTYECLFLPGAAAPAC